MAKRSEFVVTGPGANEWPVSSRNVGVSLATTLATRPGTEPGSWYVHAPGGGIVVAIERHPDGLVTITPKDREESRL